MQSTPLLLLALRLLSISASTTYDLSDSQLELVQLIFRHGERVPNAAESYPKDPYGGRYSSASGQLTELGHWRAHRLGLALRRHYADLLAIGEDDNVYAYSADRDYSRASLNSLLDALLYGTGRSGMKQASPRIRSMPRELDMLMSSRDCSRFRIELDRLRRTAEVQAKLAKYEGLYTYLTEKAGVTFDEVNVDEQLYNLHELLEYQRSLNLTLPNWCTEGVLGLLQELAFLHYNLESQTVELKRLNGGPLVRRFLEEMTAERSRARIQLYSGDGHNVAAFARAHGKCYPRVPNYGSAVIVEKWRRSGARLFVRIMIWTGVTEKLFPLQLRACPVMCPIEDYERIVAEVVPSDQELDCLIHDLKDGVSR